MISVGVKWKHLKISKDFINQQQGNKKYVVQNMIDAAKFPNK